MIKINRENFLGTFINNLTKLLNPPKDLILRGYCSKPDDKSIKGSFPDVIVNSETQIRHCNCQESGNCKKESGVVASAIPPRY